MDSVPKIAKLLKKQRKVLSLTLEDVSKMTGVSVAELGRIEQGQRRPSTQTIQKLARGLGFDVHELLVMTGHLRPGPTASLSQRDVEKLRAELDMLTNRVASDATRIQEIMDKLLH